MKYMWLFLWILTLVAGACFHSLAPSNWWYIIGFLTGCFSPLLLQLADYESRRED